MSFPDILFPGLFLNENLVFSAAPAINAPLMAILNFAYVIFDFGSFIKIS
jgi:hypothetical protein